VLYQVELRPSVDRSSRKSGTPEAQYRGGLHARQRRRAGPLLRFPQVTPDNRPVEARRPQALEAGLFPLVAALARPDEPSWRTAVIFVALGSGFAVVGERSAFLLPPVALLATWWFVRPDRRRLVLAVGAMGRRHRVVDAGSERDRQPIRSRPGRGAVRDLTAERKRFAMWQAQARAVIDRPILGWVRGTNGAPSCPPGPRSR